MALSRPVSSTVSLDPSPIIEEVFWRGFLVLLPFSRVVGKNLGVSSIDLEGCPSLEI